MNTILRITSMVTAVAILAGWSASARAAAVAIVNPDFETDAAADPGGPGPGGANALVTGWGIPGGSFGQVTHGTLDPGIDEGALFAGENNYYRAQVRGNGAGALGGTSFASGGQTVPTTIMANSRYTLTVDITRQSSVAFASNVPATDTYPNSATFNNGLPILLIRLVNVAGASIGFGETSGVSLVSNSPIPAASSMTTWTREYTTNAAPANLGGALFLQLFLQTNTASGTQEVLYDNVRLDVVPTVVPEPTSTALFGLAGAALIWMRRKQR
jgi:hypothetical protein